MPLVTLLTAILLGMVISGCQPRPDALRLAPAETEIQPRQVVESAAYDGRQVAWGGIVVESRNLVDRTRIELLAFPLDNDGHPKVNASPTGRFLADYFGFLDPVDYGAGRRITVRGTLHGTQSGKVGEAAYTYPLVEAVEMKLWPDSSRTSNGFWPPQLNIGIGVYGGF